MITFKPQTIAGKNYKKTTYVVYDHYKIELGYLIENRGWGYRPHEDCNCLAASELHQIGDKLDELNKEK